MKKQSERYRIAANFRRLRLGKGWTILQAAKKGKVSFGYIGHIEREVTTLTPDTMAKWAKVFRVSPDEFLLPIGDEEQAMEKELQMLRKEAEKYDIDFIQRLRNQIPILAKESKK